MRKTVSIIVPIYNAEKYIAKCIESIINQTFSNYELILINDGSTDNSIQIIKNYEKKYDNIKVFNNKNRGVSYTRNFGLKNATGKYIMFVDADDFLENNCLENLLCNIEDGDIIISNYYRYYGKNKKILKNGNIGNKVLGLDEFKEYFFYYYRKNITNSPCARLYRKCIIDKYNLEFDEDYSLGEDLIFNLNYLKYVHKIVFVNDYLYYYRLTPNSLSNKFIINYLNIKMKLIKYIEDFLYSNNERNEYIDNAINAEKCNVIIGTIQNLFLPNSKLNNNEIRVRISEIIENNDYMDIIKKCQFKSISQKIIKRLVVLKNVRLIIFLCRIKEMIKKVLKII